jgi:hypothetical protein
MSNEVILPKGFDCYVRDVARIANELGSKMIVNFTKDLKLYVYVEGVFIISNPTFLFGTGTTLEDACIDYMRKVRGLKVKNAANDRESSYI